MFQHFLTSVLRVSHMLWEVVGAICLPAIFFFLWDFRRHWRHLWPYLAVAGFVGICAWRLLLNIGSGRYFSVLILPLMLLIFHFGWRILPRVKWAAYGLFAVLFVICLMRDFRGNPVDARVMSLYRKVGEDAKRYVSPQGVAFQSRGWRETFYSGIRVAGIKYGGESAAEYIRSIHGNLDTYGSFADVVYLFIALSSDAIEKHHELRKLMPDAELFGQTALDRRGHKKLFVIKYIPRIVAENVSETKLLPNGDFSQIAEGTNVPPFWRIDSVWSRKNLSGAKTVARNGKNALRFWTDDSLSVFSPGFPVAERRVFFCKIRANENSELEVDRIYRYDRKSLFSPMFRFFLCRDKEYDCIFTLPPQGGGCLAQVTFSLQSGDIELSDVRIK